VLGSRSTDVLSGIGPAIVSKGSRLKIADPTIGARAAGGRGAGAPNPGVDVENEADPAWFFPRPGDQVLLDIILGPRDDWFDAPSLDRLRRQDWTVTPQSNRVGLRLEGEQPMTRAKGGELPSEGMVAGAIEVPPSGQPVLFLADHPLTGGYPVVAVAMGRDLNKLAQVSPGVRLKFRVA
jgi:allophanate hydrolase subunit 2